MKKNVANRDQCYLIEPQWEIIVDIIITRTAQKPCAKKISNTQSNLVE